MKFKKPLSLLPVSYTHLSPVTASLLLAVMMVLSLAACGAKGETGSGDAVTGEPKNAEEAVAMHKELMAQENAIPSENTALWEKVFLAADKSMTCLLYTSYAPGWSC